MTPTKIRKNLVELMEKYGPTTRCIVYHDKWVEGKPEREVILMRELITFYDSLESPFRKYLSITSNYISFEKMIKKGECIHIDKLYWDSYDKFMNEWKEKHPGEDYEEWTRKRRHKDFQDFLGFMARYGFQADEQLKKVYYY